MKRNPAREALNRAVDKAIAAGSPVYVNQPANGSLPYACEIVSAEGEVEISTNVASVSDAVQWLRDNGISMEQIDAVPRLDYCIFRYQRKTVVPCYVCQGTCLGHEPIEAGDVFESTSGNVWQVVAVKDREFGQYAEVFSPNGNPQYHYCWSVDSLRMMRRLKPLTGVSAFTGETVTVDNVLGPEWDEYDRAASDLARKGLTGKIGDDLPNLMSSAAVALINADVDAFRERVKGFAYAYAMAASQVLCPQCNSEDATCTLCDGNGVVSRSQASEYIHQHPEAQ